MIKNIIVYILCKLFFLFFFFDMSTQEGEGGFELMTFALDIFTIMMILCDWSHLVFHSRDHMRKLQLFYFVFLDSINLNSYFAESAEQLYSVRWTKANKMLNGYWNWNQFFQCTKDIVLSTFQKKKNIVFSAQNPNSLPVMWLNYLNFVECYQGRE